MASLTPQQSLPSSCDYLVIGAGATGMAFCDTLLRSGEKVSIVLVDRHEAAGGQWNDSYSFVRLHQPSNMYGVECKHLESEPVGNEEHRATRNEILSYYEQVKLDLEKNYDFHFLGGMNFDMKQLESGALPESYSLSNDDGFKVQLRVKKVVDARYLEPDLPVFVKPKFSFNPDIIKCISPNELPSTSSNENTKFVVIGAGKTGMDTIIHLLTVTGANPNDVTWVMPNDAWITARENIGSCIEYLHTCTKILQSKKNGDRAEALSSNALFQDGFQQWEREGRIYRLDPDVLPTKFKDATLCRNELETIRKVQNIVRQGRVTDISDSGTLHFADGSTLDSTSDVATTTFVHCSAGAFNYTKQLTGSEKLRPIFDGNLITIQDVYGTPGFCFVGSIIGKLESLSRLDCADKNAMCKIPVPNFGEASKPLGPSSGDIGLISSSHGLVQRLDNLRQWLATPEIRPWLLSNRLFNLKHMDLEEVSSIVGETTSILQEFNVVQA